MDTLLRAAAATLFAAFATGAAAADSGQAPEARATAERSDPADAALRADNARERRDAAAASTSPGTAVDDDHGYRDGNRVGLAPDTAPKGDARPEGTPGAADASAPRRGRDTPPER